MAEISTRPAHLLSRVDARAPAEVGRFRGWVVKQTGDGMLATFVVLPRGTDRIMVRRGDEH